MPYSGNFRLFYDVALAVWKAQICLPLPQQSWDGRRRHQAQPCKHFLKVFCSAIFEIGSVAQASHKLTVLPLPQSPELG